MGCHFIVQDRLAIPIRRNKLASHQRTNRTVHFNEIPQAANRVLRYVPDPVRAADRVVGAELSAD